MKSLYLNFYGFNVLVKSEDLETIELLEKDFKFFQVQETGVLNLELFIHNEEDFDKLLPKSILSKKQSINSITYDYGGKRYNDYYSNALTIYNKKENKCDIYSSNLSLLHELSYLVILSKQGKWSDLNGLHKIHAMGITNGEKNLILMMPMKGGKTTTFIKFIENSKFGLLSDDTPMIDSNGEIKSFPIRIGIEEKEYYKGFLEKIDEHFLYSLNRSEYGKKILIDLSFFKDRFIKPGKKTILVQGIRQSSGDPILKKCSRLKMFKHLIINMIVGFGLPMVIEYFIENTIRDHFRNVLIFFKRSKASLLLLFKSECYELKISKDIDKNYDLLKKLL